MIIKRDGYPILKPSTKCTLMYIFPSPFMCSPSLNELTPIMCCGEPGVLYSSVYKQLLKLFACEGL